MWKWLKGGGRPKKQVRNEVRNHLTQHMGGPCADAQTIAHPIKPIERVNLQLALDGWFGGNAQPGRLLGYTANIYSRSTGMSQLLADKDVALAPVERERFPSGPGGEELDCVTRGLYLLHHDGRPVVVLLRASDSPFERPVLELMARERETARDALGRLLDEVRRHSVYKGRTITLESEDYPRRVLVHFRELPPTPREQIVLPESVLAVVERNVLGLVQHADVLRRSGRATRHGLLFHGPPGTGKTLMLRYLAGACPEHTVILMSGRQMGLIRESCQVARLLAPALILLEDVDLVAEDRDHNRCPAVLHELLDEMDGLGPKADCIFLLTSNRPEVLEPALAARPGRIDQAVEFPLPDEECRRRLFALYGRGLDLAGVEVPRWVEKTEGVSPAFIEELLRKAGLMAAERGESEAPLRLRDEDLARALEELVCFGGELTQHLLGFRSIGYRSPGRRA
jgi:hypothetical protein